MTMSDTRTIVVIGGGFAGTTLARELDGRLPAGWQLLLISEESYTTFNPLLPEALGASIFPSASSPSACSSHRATRCRHAKGAWRTSARPSIGLHLRRLRASVGH
jgi:NADH dehydrogenase FAD-containing subunit